ncbi:uncharacterized protein BJ171DRAFT_617201 [Polychytrium aggregatum]|uniref:uncharacterized protein n=1 Tax=Polychytrium aggregatum TaxID=110093 RepID=UPI0022FE4805|nr:uncharacterized protein BJ171DRAFT_617201 [Polychytrium aggregatum]KAI9205209.1 hypothetical protein BJ171DRAFT_617201 [Polychytrium aggregatum]
MSQRKKDIPIQPKRAIVAFGNPGTGKSAVLNSMVGKTVFQSGVAYNGTSLTQHRQIHQHGDVLVIDTPGLQEAGENKYKKNLDEFSAAISTGLPTRLIGFVNTISGRVVESDLAAVLTVFSAVKKKFPKRANEDWIIINRVPAGKDHVLEKVINIVMQACFNQNLGVYIGFINHSAHGYDQDNVLFELNENQKKLMDFEEKLELVIPKGVNLQFDEGVYKKILLLVACLVVAVVLLPEIGAFAATAGMISVLNLSSG